MRILILTDKYYPAPLANAICVQNVADELVKQGNEIDIIAYQDTKITGSGEYHSMAVSYVKPDYRTQLFYYTRNFPNSKYFSIADTAAKCMNRVKKMIMLPFFPVYSFSFPKRILKKMEQLHSQKKYDIVVSVFAPFDAALAAYWFKKKCPDVQWCLYTVDTFINQRYRFLNKQGNHNQWLYRFLDTCDMFIYMRSREKEYADSRFDKWRKKMLVSDIPLMTEVERLTGEANEDDTEHWVYAGSLGAPHYRTEDLIKIFLALPQDQPRILHFYSSGKELEELKAIEKQTGGRIKANNYVSHEELMKIYRNAAVLVSMKYTDQISAKIFEYMSYGKNVVHVSGCDSDPNAEYVKNYINGCVLNVYENSVESCVAQLERTLERWRNGSSSKEMDLSYFEMNRPQYTANIIMDGLK